VQQRALLILVVFLAACRTGRNYDAEGPRYSGQAQVQQAILSDTLRLVSFNVAWAAQIDSAIKVLTVEPNLQRADVLLLQEMDEPGTKQIAGALGMSYVYYPATFSTKTKRDFGNAVLTRWPIIADQKIMLPHIARFRRTRRIATAATIQVGSALVRVYAVHLGTPADISNASRRDQLAAIIKDAEQYRRVIIGGDMNNRGVGEVAKKRGYLWPTENNDPTIKLWNWDHFFLKGFTVPDSAAAGTIRENRKASDHRPIWARAILPVGGS
jgi:endonuclease/exonuclease/phosphatase family metal-dependent hydrolase